MLPASFVLRLNKPMPVCVVLHQQLKKISEAQTEEIEEKKFPLLSLIAKTVSNGEITSVSRGVFVSVPEQCHCYCMTESCMVNKTFRF